MTNHEHFMRRCLELARKALANGESPVGAILVRDGKIVGQGVEGGRSRGDVTCHAEIEAVRDALGHLLASGLADCTLYTTHEPCIMCSYVIGIMASGKWLSDAGSRLSGGCLQITPF